MKSLFLLLIVLATVSNDLDNNIFDGYFKKSDLNYLLLYNESVNAGVSKELVEQLKQELLENSVEDFFKENSAAYKIISEEEHEKYAKKEKTGILKEYWEKSSSSDEIWIEIGTPKMFYVIRECLEDGNYLYHLFYYERYKGICGGEVCAWGKEEFYFIQWKDQVYLVTTNHNENGINGVAVYCCITQGGDYGGMVYLELENGVIDCRGYRLSTIGTGRYNNGTRWVEYMSKNTDFQNQVIESDNEQKENILLHLRNGLEEPAITAYYHQDIEDVKKISNGDIRIEYYDVDLNGDGVEDKIVTIRSPLHFGSMGDSFQILLNDGIDNYESILKYVDGRYF